MNSPALPASGPGEAAPAANPAAGRGSRELWLGAAYAALTAGGVEAVRIQPLGKALSLSRTSFYWFFKDRDDLLAGLLELWREKNTRVFVAQTRRYAESVVESLLNVFDCWLDGDLFDSAFEAAVRSWALQSPEVAAALSAADAARLAALAALFARHGIAAAEADVRARTVYLTQIGYISMKTDEDLATRMGRIPHYVAVFTGQAPRPRELARFHARHGFCPPRN